MLAYVLVVGKGLGSNEDAVVVAPVVVVERVEELVLLHGEKPALNMLARLGVDHGAVRVAGRLVRVHHLVGEVLLEAAQDRVDLSKQQEPFLKRPNLRRTWLIL